jgi:hypothetical protein
MTIASCWQFWRCISEGTAVRSDWIWLQILDWGCSKQVVPPSLDHYCCDQSKFEVCASCYYRCAVRILLPLCCAHLDITTVLCASCYYRCAVRILLLLLCCVHDLTVAQDTEQWKSNMLNSTYCIRQAGYSGIWVPFHLHRLVINISTVSHASSKCTAYPMCIL